MPPRWRFSYMAANYLSLASLAISFTALSGHVLQSARFFTRWGAGAPEMAPNTALALVLLSAGTFLFTLRREP